MRTDRSTLKRVFAPGGWRGALRKRLGLRPGRIDTILSVACTGHGASLALLTSDGVMRSTVLDRWAGTKHLLLFSRREDRAIRRPRCDLDREINFVLKYGYGKFPPTRVFEDIFDEWLAWFLRGLGLTGADIDLVVTSESHFATCRLRLGRRLKRWFPRSWIANGLEHHQIHQRQAFWQSGFERAAVLTLDSSGEPLKRYSGRTLAGTLTSMDASGRSSELGHLLFPESSPGLLYEVATHHVGFHLGDEGKTMGLAPYGSPDLYRRLLPLLHLHDDGTFDFIPHTEFQALLEDYVPERAQGEEISPRHQDIAFAAQALIERIVCNAFEVVMRRAGCRKLAYAGGVALNSVANGIAFRETQPEALYVCPNPGDTGHALGCVLFGAYEIAGWPVPLKEIPEGIGPMYSTDEMLTLAQSSSFEVCVPDDQATELARCLANGYITARFAGGAEFGPRALGNRSILCDPRRPDMKDYLNSRVKHREGFRPFAPAVLEERAAEWFELSEPSAFMLRVVPVRDHARDVIPAVVHVDGSCRVQTVAPHDNPGFYSLLRAFESITSVPVLLNTSFNVAGKPIVETPQDALNCFGLTEIDVLALGPVLVSKRPLAEYRIPRESRRIDSRPEDAEAAHWNASLT